MRQPYFKKFAQGWAIEEFLKSQLKNRRAYARKHGFLQDIANPDVQISDDDDIENADAEEENEKEEQEENEEEEEEQEQEEEQEEDLEYGDA